MAQITLILGRFIKASLLAGLLLPVLSHGGTLEPHSVNEERYFKLPNLKDESRSLSDYRGKVVLINFWASWCPPCIHEMPVLEKLKQRLADKPFEILALNVGEKKYKVRKFTRLINLDLPVLLDASSETFNAWQVKTLPTSFLIDATGTIRYRAHGNPGWESTETTNIINELLSETLKSTERNK